MDNIDQEHIYSVSELNKEVYQLLSSTFGVVWIEGEISNFLRSSAGHVYFSLKDEISQIRCAMFRQQNQLVSFPIEDGKQILARARVGLYQPRGEYQLIVDYIEEAGEGLLRQRFERLKSKLQQEGLFDSTNKLPLPEFPQTLGVITSPSGAAIQDIFNIMRRRFPCINVIVYPTLVQGREATQQISRAIEIANERNECEVLILARGGGSLEDLWCFNEEQVARAMFHSQIPIISGIGHETDVTIADLVADYRAPTPSGAAEVALPDADDILQRLQNFNRQFYNTMKLLLAMVRQKCLSLDAQLQQQHPISILEQYNQRLDLALQRIKSSPREYLAKTSSRINVLNACLFRSSPLSMDQNMKSEVTALYRRLIVATRGILGNTEQLLSIAVAKLDGVSPLNALGRGYAYVVDPGTQRNIKSIRQIKVGSTVKARLKDGSFGAKISSVDPIKPKNRD